MIRLGRSFYATVAFLIGALILILAVSHYFLLPALEVAQDASVPQKRQLVAYSRLVLSIVLLILFVSLILLFRVGRFFFPSSRPKPVKTQYVDVWAEAGKRVSPPQAEEEHE